jgi:oligopeptide/dipeptide ABC transporter ATP-binding protein
MSGTGNSDGGRGDVLLIEDLHISFETRQGEIHAVNGIDLRIGPGEVLGLVGESGCGKSVTALSILRLIPSPGRVTHGRVLLFGEDVLSKSEAEMRRIRGDRVGIVFQGALASLNPVVPIGRQVGEPLVNHRGQSWQEAVRSAVGLLESVRIPGAAERVHSYPHELSGGMQQRAVIAMAMACEPALLIADEPTTALDVTIQAQILNLIRDVRQTRRASMLFITHNLDLVAELCDRVAVMYAGRIVETASVDSLFRAPQHPYTRALLSATPRMGRDERLVAIEGQPPELRTLPLACYFMGRCPLAAEDCLTEPGLTPRSKEHWARCWRTSAQVAAIAGRGNDGRSS